MVACHWVRNNDLDINPLLSIGMKLLNLLAGLNAALYRNEPQAYQHGNFAKSDMPFEMEKGNSDETLQATVHARSRWSARDLQEQLDSTGCAFASDRNHLDTKTSN